MYDFQIASKSSPWAVEGTHVRSRKIAKFDFLCLIVLVGVDFNCICLVLLPLYLQVRNKMVRNGDSFCKLISADFHLALTGAPESTSSSEFPLTSASASWVGLSSSTADIAWTGNDGQEIVPFVFWKIMSVNASDRRDGILTFPTKKKQALWHSTIREDVTIASSGSGRVTNCRETTRSLAGWNKFRIHRCVICKSNYKSCESDQNQIDTSVFAFS